MNPRPADYKSAALPTELHQRTAVVVFVFSPDDLLIIPQGMTFVKRFSKKIFDFFCKTFRERWDNMKDGATRRAEPTARPTGCIGEGQMDTALRQIRERAAKHRWIRRKNTRTNGCKGFADRNIFRTGNVYMEHLMYRPCRHSQAGRCRSERFGTG